MLGRQERWQEDLFIAAPLRDLIPDDHILGNPGQVIRDRHQYRPASARRGAPCHRLG